MPILEALSLGGGLGRLKIVDIFLTALFFVLAFTNNFNNRTAIHFMLFFGTINPIGAIIKQSRFAISTI